MDKPFLTFEQQIEKLKNDYELEIYDEDFALEALSSVSYYDLVNGYKSLFMTENKKYIKNASLELLFETHIYNKNIQSVFMKYSTYVENSFKTILSHTIAEHLSEDHRVYLDITKYKKSRYPDHHRRFKELMRSLSQMCIDCEDNPTRHYIDTKNHIPPWILFRNVSFSDVTDLFRNMKSVHKESVLKRYPIYINTNLNYQEQFSIHVSALRFVRKFRNKIAHNLDFMSYRNSEIDKSAFRIFEGTLINMDELERDNHDIWTLVTAIVILLNNRYLIQNFLAELNSYLTANPNVCQIYCYHTGIPLDFESRIISFNIAKGY